MSTKPIFLATHPRSCSTAFERVFMTREDLECLHEPFGDAFYYGPERLSSRFEEDVQTRLQSGFGEITYKEILNNLEAKRAEGKRLFIKDMAYYLLPPNGAIPKLAPTCARIERGIGTENEDVNGNAYHKTNGACISNATHIHGNPTVLPKEILQGFHFVFLIRHPRYSIPSFFRCTVSPLDKITGWYDFVPNEAGYSELRRLFDYLRTEGQVGPRVTSCNTIRGNIDGNESAGYHEYSIASRGEQNVSEAQKKVHICVIDADDLLDDPARIVSTFCQSVGLEYQESMLKWDTEKDRNQAEAAFQKWPGFHEDALNSNDLKPRTHHKKTKTDEEQDAEWHEKFGESGAKVIRETVNANIADYEYLKQFAMTVVKKVG